MDRREATVVHRAKHALAEGPVWWEGELYWVDIVGHSVQVLQADESFRVYPVGNSVGALVPWGDSGLLLALASGCAHLDLESGALTRVGSPASDRPDNRFNDGKCDPQGRFVVGTMACDALPEAGAVYQLNHDLVWKRVHGPTTISNGLAWSADGEVLYHTDTPTRQVRAFDYKASTGEWSNGRVVIELPPNCGDPDGMTIDRDGNLWIALWGGWGVECWSPGSGERLARIEVPAAQVTCPTFGGADFGTLFITTARAGLEEAGGIKQQPLAGSLFAVKPGVEGYPATPFEGTPVV